MENEIENSGFDVGLLSGSSLENKRKEKEISAGSSVKKKRKTVDDKINEAKALLKLLTAEKKKAISGKSKSLTKKSKGMSNLIAALQVVVTENKVSNPPLPPEPVASLVSIFGLNFFLLLIDMVFIYKYQKF